MPSPSRQPLPTQSAELNIRGRAEGFVVDLHGDPEIQRHVMAQGHSPPRIGGKRLRAGYEREEQEPGGSRHTNAREGYSQQHREGRLAGDEHRANRNRENQRMEERHSGYDIPGRNTDRRFRNYIPDRRDSEHKEDENRSRRSSTSGTTGRNLRRQPTDRESRSHWDETTEGRLGGFESPSRKPRNPDRHSPDHTPERRGSLHHEDGEERRSSPISTRGRDPRREPSDRTRTSHRNSIREEGLRSFERPSRNTDHYSPNHNPTRRGSRHGEDEKERRKSSISSTRGRDLRRQTSVFQDDDPGLLLRSRSRERRQRRYADLKGEGEGRIPKGDNPGLLPRFRPEGGR